MTLPWLAPATVKNDRLHVVPLTLSLLTLDTAAYRSSPDAISAHSGGEWPVATAFTEADNAPLISRHEQEHARGDAFAYALLTPDGKREVGCAYLRPLGAHLDRTGVKLDGVAPEGAILTFWLIDDAAARPSTSQVLETLVQWACEWRTGDVVLRCRESEAATVDAARELGLAEVVARGAPSPFRWFAVTEPGPSW